MNVNPGLGAAVAVFRELGWADATPAEAPSLPLGTADQRRTAVAGLRSGPWGEIAQTGANNWGWVSVVGVEEAMLALFAVRVGVDARRAAALLPRLPDDLLAEVVAGRGAAFASAFIAATCTSRHRWWEHATSLHGGAAVRLVVRCGLPVPENVEYLKDWAAFAAAAMTGDPGQVYPPDRGVPEPELIRERLSDHLAVAVGLPLPATGPWGDVVPAAVRRGWLGRDEAVEIGFAALEASQRPGDRKRWLEILTGELALTPVELCGRADALVGVLATGDAWLVERLAPPLLAGLDDEGAAAEVALVALLTSTKKALRAVLAALAARRPPAPEVAELLAPRLAELAADRDRALARAAAQLLDAWPVAGGVAPPTTADAAPGGLWRPTPPRWDLPAFDRGPVSPEALADALAAVVNRGESTVDVAFERFLALANAVARRDPGAARLALRGIRGAHLPAAQAWVRDEPPAWGLDRPGRSERERRVIYDALWAREFSVFQRLGQVPCLLSEPSTEDLRITLPDLVARLGEYHAAGADASEADLLLALLRLVPGGEPAGLARLAVPIVGQSGRRLPRSAGKVVAAYLSDPLRDPGLVTNSSSDGWVCGPLAWPNSLRDFPVRVTVGWAGPPQAAVPGWGDAGHLGLRWAGEIDRQLGIVARQAVRRAAPLPPGAAINLLAVQRPTPPEVAADAATAVLEAWERGLLPPGVADVTYLDWSRRPPTTLAVLARALREVAEQGLLSVVWPVLNDLIAASLAAPRLLAGTADLAEAMAALLPEVVAAVASGAAPAEALDVASLRALAARPGSAQAVATARAAVSGLPASAAVAPPPAKPDVDLDAVWPPTAGTRPALPDGLPITVGWVDPAAPTRRLFLELTLPGRPGVRYRVDKHGWVYDLEAEGQCVAEEVPADPTAPRPAWLHWDEASASLVAAAHRDWRADKDGPLSGPVTPLPDVMVAVALTLLAGDGDTAHLGRWLVRNLARDERLGSAAVRAAIVRLLPHEAFSPAKAVMSLETTQNLLPHLWPLLTEPIRFAGESAGPLPRWLNRVLDVALLRADLLRAAAQSGRLPDGAAAWPGLAEIAARPGSSAAVTKARTLRAALLP